MTVTDERGGGKQLKRLLPTATFRFLTVLYNSLMRFVPFWIKYEFGARIRKFHAPYRFLRPDDTVVQIGSARDVVYAGRSRAIHLASFVPQGRVVVIEADRANCLALRWVINEHHLKNITVVESGAWNTKTTLAFLSSSNHPASNLLEDVKDLSEEVVKRRKYQKQFIEVDSVDNILKRLDVGLPELVSITTNGAELKILEGMKDTIARGCRYISLASSREGLIEEMNALGYEYIVRDDRGYCFRKKMPALAGFSERKV